MKHNTERVSMEKATERPWKLGDSKKDGMSFTRQIETSLMGHCSIGYTEAPSGSEVMIKRSEANAALIVRAVNSHEKLLAALDNLVDLFRAGKNYETQNPYTRPEVKAALEAIKEATGFKGDWMDAKAALKLAKGELRP